jgi:ATP-dependent RNA helicase DeaD
MLDMGFAEELEAILQETPAERQTALFSATFPPRINALVKKYMRDPERIAIKAEVRKTPRVRQVAYTVPRPHKLEALGRILDIEAPASAIVFCRTRTEVDELAEALAGRGYSPEALHGGYAQAQRDRVMGRFREGVADILIATDVAARGLDIEHVSHVINYDIPESPEVYVHRIGRTGRAGREGVAITLVQPREHYLLKAIEKVVKQRIEPARIPTVADVRARRMETLVALLRETLVEDDFAGYRGAVQTLAEEFDPLDVAAAAAKLAGDAMHGEQGEDEQVSDIQTPVRPERQREAPKSKGERFAADSRDGSRPPKRRPDHDRMVRLVITAGEQRGIRPKDLVGAIAGEADIKGSSIGAIEIRERHSLVEVPESLADKVIRALSKATIKGQHVTAKRDKA